MMRTEDTAGLAFSEKNVSLLLSGPVRIMNNYKYSETRNTKSPAPVKRQTIDMMNETARGTGLTVHLVDRVM